MLCLCTNFLKTRPENRNVKGPIHDQSCCATLRVVQHDWSCMVLIDLIVNGQTCAAQNNFAQHDWSCMGRLRYNETPHLFEGGQLWFKARLYNFFSLCCTVLCTDVSERLRESASHWQKYCNDLSRLSWVLYSTLYKIDSLSSTVQQKKNLTETFI
jgi:hypothetical protein